MLEMKIFYFATVFFLSFLLFNKWIVQNYLIELSNKFNIKLLYDLSSCIFCLNFHLSWLVFIPFFFFTNLSIENIIIYNALWLAIKSK